MALGILRTSLFILNYKLDRSPSTFVLQARRSPHEPRIHDQGLLVPGLSENTNLSNLFITLVWYTINAIMRTFLFVFSKKWNIPCRTKFLWFAGTNFCSWGQIGFFLWELIFAIFRKYQVPRIDYVFVFLKYSTCNGNNSTVCTPYVKPVIHYIPFCFWMKVRDKL